MKESIPALYLLTTFFLPISFISSEPVFQVYSLSEAKATGSPTSPTVLTALDGSALGGDIGAANEVGQIGDIFHGLYESVLYGQKQRVSFKIKSPEGVVYLYDLVCGKGGACDVKIQSRTKGHKGNPTEALELFIKGNVEVQFLQPELKVENTSAEIVETLKGTNQKITLVNQLWTKTYKMKNLSKEKRAQFTTEVLKAHNKLREHHGTEPLVLEKKLMEDAQSYAEKCARSGSIVPRPQASPYGENIWGLTTNASDLEDFHGGRPVEKWYAEVRRYTFGQEPEDNSAGHLTQLLWAKSQFLGVGMAANDNGQLFVICEYYPPGNYLGEHAANVKPLQTPFTDTEAEDIFIPTLTSLSSLSLSSANQTVAGLTPRRNTTNLSPEDLALIELYTLKFHNEKRELHYLPPLSYGKELEALAQHWAEHLLDAENFYHRPDNKFGENIYYYTATFYLDDKESIRKAVAAWYDEIAAYGYFGEEPTLEALTGGNPTGHFTQVVWNATTHVGLGLARKDSDESHLVVVVANYAPAGNVLGKFRDNVPPPSVSTETKNVAKREAKGTKTETKQTKSVTTRLTTVTRNVTRETKGTKRV